MKVKLPFLLLWLAIILIGAFIDYFIKDSGFSYCVGFCFGAFAQSILILGGED